MSINYRYLHIYILKGLEVCDIPLLLPIWILYGETSIDKHHATASTLEAKSGGILVVYDRSNRILTLTWSISLLALIIVRLLGHVEERSSISNNKDQGATKEHVVEALNRAINDVG